MKKGLSIFSIFSKKINISSISYFLFTIYFYLFSYSIYRSLNEFLLIITKKKKERNKERKKERKRLNLELLKYLNLKISYLLIDIYNRVFNRYNISNYLSKYI